MSTGHTVTRSRLVVALAFAMGGCVTFQPLEPKLSPPPQYQTDVTAPVEFIAPLQIGFRCAERGAKFLGLPGINSAACADTHLMTLPDPCLTLTAGAYARDLCDELSQLRLASQPATTRGTARHSVTPSPLSQSPSPVPAAYAVEDDTAPAPNYVSARAEKETGSLNLNAGGSKPGADEFRMIEVEFVLPSRLAARCAEGGAVLAGEGSAACRDGSQLKVANPCHVEQRSWYTELLCHEMGHVNGWAADHSGAVAGRTRLPFASESPQALALADR